MKEMKRTITLSMESEYGVQRASKGTILSDSSELNRSKKENKKIRKRK